MFFRNPKTIFKQLEHQSSPVLVWPAVVQSIEGDACTVKLVQAALVIEGIVIPALVINEPAPDKALSARPAIGSTVLIGTIIGIPDKIMLMQVIEEDNLYYQTGELIG